MLRDGSAAILEPSSRGIIGLNTEQIFLETILIRRGLVVDVNVGRKLTESFSHAFKSSLQRSCSYLKWHYMEVLNSIISYRRGCFFWSFDF